MSRKSWALSDGIQTDDHVLTKLKLVQTYLVIAYAVSLPLSLTASWIILIAGLICWACQIAVSPQHAFKQLIGAPLFWPIAAFAAVVFVSGALAGGIGEAFNSLYCLKHLLVYGWAFHVFSENRRDLLLALQAMLVTGAIAGAWGTVQQVTGFHPFGYQYLQGTGFLGDPMVYAGQMQLLGFLALAILLARGYGGFRGVLNKPWIFGIVCFFNCLGILFASERSAWLGALFAAAAMGMLMSWKNLAKIILVLILVAGFSWTFVPVVKTRLEPLSDWRQDISVRVRFFLWEQAVEIWQSAPLTGIGIRKFPHFNIPEAIVPGRAIDINHAHSNYLHILATTGVLGLLAFLCIWLRALYVAATVYKRGPSGEPDQSLVPLKALALGIFAGTVSMMMAGIFEYNFGTAHVRMTQWFVLSMLPPLAVRTRQAERAESSSTD